MPLLRLLLKPGGFEGLGAVEVVVGLDDEAVPQAMHDGEGLSVGRVRTLPDHARAGNQAAISDINQLIEAHLDRAHQVDQTLHAFKGGCTPFIDTGIGPARPLAVDGILSPELIRHRCWTRLIPNLIGPPDFVSVLLRHPLLLKPGGFEGICFVVELANARDHPVPEREQLVVGRANLGATRCAAPHLGSLDENLIASAVDDPLDLIPVVSEALELFLEPLPDSLTAPIGRSVFGCAPLDIGMAERHRPGHRGHADPSLLRATSYHRAAISTFSCDIARAVSPLEDASPTRSGREGIRVPANDAASRLASSRSAASRRSGRHR